MVPLILLALIQSSALVAYDDIDYVLPQYLEQVEYKPTAQFVDSNDDSKITFIIVNTKNKTCKVPVLKTDLKQMDKVVDLIVEKCGL